MVVEIDGGSAGRQAFDVKGDRRTPRCASRRPCGWPPGRTTISVAYVNDYGSGKEDRNLFVDWVGVGPVAQKDGPPALSLAEGWVRQARKPVAPNWTFTQAGAIAGLAGRRWRRELTATADGFACERRQRRPGDRR